MVGAPAFPDSFPVLLASGAKPSFFSLLVFWGCSERRTGKKIEDAVILEPLCVLPFALLSFGARLSLLLLLLLLVCSLPFTV